ncbi:hypothetical protein [Agathobaculum sp.]|uniref:hypothetical protein n=1 Tax=Agathobaculum sp. TaxID=2048138 RepID=UPI002A7EBC01|nr:hypothetical protein [Agathobaculum sp.]MDY3618469.1 hypothetical protein [Agathobaculum sp.]
MKNKVLSVLIATACVMTVSAGAADVTSAPVEAKPSTQPVYVDGVKVNVAAYSINNNNYFKVRDIAAVVSGTEKQFEVIWDSGKQAVSLTSGKPYTVVGGEMGAVVNKVQQAKPSTDKILKDGAEIKYTGFNINDNNYYKLRDVGQSFDFGVEWNSAKQRVDIITTKGYSEDGAVTDPVDPEQEPVGKPEEKPNESKPGNNNAPHAQVPDVLPPDGEMSYEYQAYLDNCGEELMTFTIPFKVFDSVTNEPRANVEVQVWGMRYTDVGSIFVTKLKSDANGRGSFTISMPKTIYEKSINKDPQFCIAGASASEKSSQVPDATIDGINYKMITERLDEMFLQENPATAQLPLLAPSFMN